MFATSLLRVARTSVSQQCALIAHQQVRFSKKNFRLRTGEYGAEPLITADEFEEAKEAKLLEDLSFKEIRFALSWENNSPSFDREYERFIRFLMKDGSKELCYELMHQTFMKIKMIQYSKLRKLKEKQDGDSLLNLEYIESIQSKHPSPEQVDGEPELGQQDEGYVELNPMTIFKTALANCEPLVITRRIKRGGATYQVPYPLVKSQSEYFAIKWVLAAVMERPKPRKKHFPEVMAQELLDAYHAKGKVIKRRDDIHRLADANKAYAHYRWG